MIWAGFAVSMRIGACCVCNISGQAVWKDADVISDFLADALTLSTGKSVRVRKLFDHWIVTDWRVNDAYMRCGRMLTFVLNILWFVFVLRGGGKILKLRVTNLFNFVIALTVLVLLKLWRITLVSYEDCKGRKLEKCPLQVCNWLLFVNWMELWA